jgi:hypothetical protein
MCDECDVADVQYVAYFNKAGGKLWRPAQKPMTAWSIDIRPVAPVENAFACENAGGPVAGPALENAIAQTEIESA